MATVKGGKAVIYPDKNGKEVKREPLARYLAREDRKAAKTSTKSRAMSINDSTVTEIVAEIVLDIITRSGLSHEWNSTAAGVQEEIKEAWANIIKSKFEG